MKNLIALLLLGLPIGLVLYINTQLPTIAMETFSQDKAASYKDGAGLLISFSQTLITISLSTLAAAGYLLLNQTYSAKVFCGSLGMICLLASVVSIYFAARLAYWASYSVVAEQGDIQFLIQLFAAQSFAQLFAASAVGALMFRVSLR